MKTTKFELNIGVNPGYYHRNEDDPGIVPSVWQDIIETIFKKSGIIVGAVITPALTVFTSHHGCPAGGENTALITGLRNPNFCQDDEKWRDAVREASLSIKLFFNQTTAYLSFWEIEFEYLSSKEKSNEIVEDLKKNYLRSEKDQLTEENKKLKETIEELRKNQKDPWPPEEYEPFP